MSKDVVTKRLSKPPVQSERMQHSNPLSEDSLTVVVTQHLIALAT